MLIFDSVCVTDKEAWIEERKYLHKNGVLYTIRNREEDPDFSKEEEWEFLKWKGPKCRRKADQQLFTEAVHEMKRIIQSCENSAEYQAQFELPKPSKLKYTYLLPLLRNSNSLILRLLLQSIYRM